MSVARCQAPVVALRDSALTATPPRLARMRVVAPGEILAALDEDVALAAIERAFRRLHRGEAQVAAVGHLAFDDPPGDCHIKSAHLRGDDEFVVKVATSFYRNPERGLPSSNGFMAVISARTGTVRAILHD